MDTYKKNGEVLLDLADKKDKKLAIFVCFYSLAGMINIAIKVSLNVSPTIWVLTSRVFQLLLMILLLDCISTLLKRKGIGFIFMEILFIIAYCFSFLLGNADSSLLASDLFESTCVVLPVAFATIATLNRQILYNCMVKTGYIALVLSFFFWVFSAGTSSAESYSMGFAGYILVFILVQWNEFLTADTRKKMIVHGVCSVYGMIFIVLYANRASLICIMFFIVIRLLKTTVLTPKTFIRTSTLSIVMLVIAINYKTLVIYVFNKLAQTGKASYSITSMLNGEFFKSNERLDLFQYYWDLIKQKPIIGWGIDGGFLGEGNGPHNVLLELLLAFGFFVGGAIVLFLIFAFIQVCISKTCPTVDYDLLLIYASSIIMKFVSSGAFFRSVNLIVFLLLYIEFTQSGLLRNSFFNYKIRVGGL
ncbi:MAG: O-antigen ligase family protein [Firmicutes bacterium]|nr:O-antigen ligase family protein [Bacillota bacterium]